MNWENIIKAIICVVFLLYVDCGFLGRVIPWWIYVLAGVFLALVFPPMDGK